MAERRKLSDIIFNRNETQYKDACELQILQSQINELAKNVSEFHLKKDHFELKQKRLIDSLDKEDG